MTQTAATFPLGGGLDTNSAALAVNPSRLIYGLNYEPLAEGYGRVDGYERYDGRTAPSAAQFYVIPFDTGLTAINTGNTVTGLTSGATGYVVAEPNIETGSWAAGNAAGYIPVVAVAGTFQSGEALRVGGVTRATATGTADLLAAPTDALYTTWLEATQAYYRALIAVVPGEGPVRGVAVHDGTVYAWRNATGGASKKAYRATTAGWIELTYSKRLAFTVGLVAGIVDGDVVTKGAASATVVHVVVTSGSFAAGNAVGFLYLTGQTGTFSAGALQVGGTNRATIAGDSTTNTFAAGGRVRTISHNFYGASDRYRLYGCDEVSPGFEMISHVPVPIYTGMTVDTPQRVFEIGNALGFTFAGGSIQFSSSGEPMIWSAVLGAGEIGMGTSITDVVQANETAVAFFGEHKIGILQGHDVSDFVFDTLTEEAGAVADTAQRIARTMYLDQRGLRSLDATQAYGNFKAGTLSGAFEAYFKTRTRDGATAVGSIVCKSKSHYRLFWDDATGLAVYMGAKEPAAIPFELGFTPYCFGQGDIAGEEAIFAGGTDGYVYRLDSGTNFDGTAISGACMTPFNHFGSQMVEKRFHKCTLELQGPPQARIGILGQFDYGDPDQPPEARQNFTVRAGGGMWDIGAWDDFAWDSPVNGVAECYIDGLGRNASFVFSSQSSLTERAHVLQAYTVHFSPRKAKR